MSTYDPAAWSNLIGTTTHNSWVNTSVDVGDYNSNGISNRDYHTVKIDGKLVVNGVDVAQTLKDISAVLGVIQRDKVLEEKYAGLRKIAAEYEAALEKYKAFEAIKDSK